MCPEQQTVKTIIEFEDEVTMLPVKRTFERRKFKRVPTTSAWCDKAQTLCNRMRVVPLSEERYKKQHLS